MNALPHAVLAPNRPVPWSVRWIVLWTTGIQPLGWSLFAIGMLVAWIFASAADWTALVHFRGPLEHAPGRIVASRQTRFSEGSGRGRPGGHRQVMAHDYRFQFNGSTYEGVSYRTGGGSMEGRAVRIEFPRDRPAMSRVQGMRRAPFGPWTLLLLALPGAGFIMAISGWIQGARARALLARGAVTPARLLDRQRTRRTVNKKVVQRLTYAYHDLLSQEHQLVVKTHEPERFESADAQRVLHDPRQPRRAMLVGQLPAGVLIADDGQAAPMPFRRVLTALLPPLVAFLVVVLGAALKLG